jgi:hypothetical protein
MTTTSEPPVERFAAALAQLHDALEFPGLLDAIDGEPVCRIDGFGDGLTTVSFRQHQVPEAYLRGILGFRLAQFLRTGLIDAQLVHRELMFHEPIVRATGPDTIHTVTLTESGRIAGYIALVGSPDRVPLPLDAPGRGRFPVELAHDVELLSELAAPGRTTHSVWEIKRFVRDHAMARGEQRDRVPWHLVLAVGRVTLALGAAVQVMIGDSGERGALRHLRLTGLRLRVIEGTTPRLPRSELMWPSYELPAERRAKPFVGVVPDDAAAYVEAVEAALRLRTEGHWLRQAIEGLVECHRAGGRLERLAG